MEVDYLPSLFSLSQSLLSFFPPVPEIRCCCGISLPGPHRVLLWYFSLSRSQCQGATVGIKPSLRAIGAKRETEMVKRDSARTATGVCETIPKNRPSNEETYYRFSLRETAPQFGKMHRETAGWRGQRPIIKFLKMTHYNLLTVARLGGKISLTPINTREARTPAMNPGTSKRAVSSYAWLFSCAASSNGQVKSQHDTKNTAAVFFSPFSRR